MKNFLVVGCGNLISALLLAQKRADVKSNNTYTLVNRTLNKAQSLATKLHPLKTNVMEQDIFHQISLKDLSKYDAVLLGIKPTQLKEVLSQTPELKNFTGEVISTLAGVSLATLKKAFSSASLHSRLMPSIVMAEILSTALMLSTTPEKSVLSTWYTESVGKLLNVKNDEQLDHLTLIFGSNAAYISALIQPWIDQLAAHLPLEQATKITIEQWRAALEFLKDKNLNEVIAKVKTPGGITAQALLTLESENYNLTIKKALKASHIRTKEVAEIVNQDL